ncbi:hypothetical protein [Halopseudomonas pelagia]|uniref:hypothetical protein n=1 Tax=Halopseudomonas pelagia TaxID=553151 RepID=UPI001268C9E7|nr:hypothetical protein [Halopseudomonas pelagia]
MESMAYPFVVVVVALETNQSLPTNQRPNGQQSRLFSQRISHHSISGISRLDALVLSTLDNQGEP